MKNYALPVLDTLAFSPQLPLLNRYLFVKLKGEKRAGQQALVYAACEDWRVGAGDLGRC
jgi:hypothetical protein